MKKFFAGILCIVMVMSLTSFSFAAEIEGTEERIIVDGVDITIDIEEEIFRAKNGITDIDAPNVMVVTDGGDDIQTYTTTRKIDIAKATSSDGQIYATTSIAIMPLANEKSDSASNNEFYVTAYGTIYWRDNFGTNNDFLGASGGWDRDKNPSTNSYPVLSNRKVKVSAGGNATDGVELYRYPSGNTFEISQDEFNYTRAFLTLRTYVTVDGANRLSLAVSASPFT